MNERNPDAIASELEAALGSYAEQAKSRQQVLLGQLSKARDLLTALAASADAEHGELNDVRAVMRNDAAELHAHLRTLTRSADRIAELEGEAAGREEALAAALERAAAIEQRMTEHSEAAQAARQKVMKLEQALAKQDESLAAANKHALESDRALAERNEQLQGAKNILADFEGRLAEQTAALDAAKHRAEGLAQELAALQKTGASGQERAGQLEQALAERQAALDAAQAEARQASEALAAGQAELARLKADAAQAAQTGQGTQQELTEAREKLSKAESDRDHAVAELTDTKSTIGDLRRQVDAASQSNEKLAEVKKLLQAERERANEIEQRMKSEAAKGSKSALATQLAEALREREEADLELATLRREIEALKGGAPAPEKPKERKKASAVPGVSGTDRSGKKRQIGDILMDAGMITLAQLDDALEEQHNTSNKHLGEILVEKEFVSEDMVAQALACQCDIEFVRLDKKSFKSATLDLLPPKLARMHRCVPLAATGDSLQLAMANPLDLIAIEDVERACQRTVTPVVATMSDIREALEAHYAPA